MRANRETGIVAAVLTGLLMLSLSGNRGGEDIREASTSVESAEEEVDRRAEELEALLDSVISAALGDYTPGRPYLEDLYGALREATGLESSDVLALEVPVERMVVLAYNLPLTASGSSRRLVMRSWTPRDPGSTEWALSPLGAPTECLKQVESYPARTLRYWPRKGGSHLIVSARSGHGKGQQAFSVWTLPEGRCVWSLPLEYGDRGDLEVDDDSLLMRIEHHQVSLAEQTARTSLIEERYEWRGGDLLLASRRIVAENQDSLPELRRN